jgi:Ca2+-binding EF-hand superfamily protein
VFEKYAVDSEIEERYAHIPRDQLLSALRKLDVEIEEDAVDDFFKKHDLDGNGLFDCEEFKQAILAPLELPSQDEIRQVFGQYSTKPSSQTDFPFIHPTKVYAALEKLNFKRRTAEKVQLYFKQGALADGKISFEEFNQAILSISPLPDEQEITRVYQEHAMPGKYQHIPIEKLEIALEALGVVVTKNEFDHHIRIVKLNFDNWIKYKAFKHIVLSPSAAEVWAKTLPFNRLIADALPKLPDCDYLRVISSLTTQEANDVVEEVCCVLKEILMLHVGQLKSSFQRMDQQVLKNEIHANSKFEVTKMAAGLIQHFYEGLEGRIGACHSFLISPTLATIFFPDIFFLETRKSCILHKITDECV